MCTVGSDVLWLRGFLFTALVPCVLGAWVPHLFVESRTLPGGRWVLGWLPTIAGAGIYIVCLIDFLNSGGTPAIFFTRPLKAVLGEEPPKLVRNGLYRLTRNPMYVGVTMAVFGQAVLYASRQIAWYGAFLWLCFHAVVVFLEEPHLRAERGEPYRQYFREVPRWLIRWR